MILREIMSLYTDFFDIRTVSLRLFEIYGERMPIGGPNANVLGKFLAQAAENKPLTVQGEGIHTIISLFRCIFTT